MVANSSAMVNQQKIIPVGCMHDINAGIEGARVLGIDWAFDMNEVINLKKGSMEFVKNELQVIVPLDPIEGARYT